MFTRSLLSVYIFLNIYFIINALRRLRFSRAGTPLALPYQEFTKDFQPLAPGATKTPEALRNSRTIRRPHHKESDKQKMAVMYGNGCKQRVNSPLKGRRIQLLAEAKVS